jgi:ATP-dependent Clp protease ATP-binding subunit ClpB
MKALSAFLRPEFINRVDEIITFNSLTEENFCSIAKIMLGELQMALAEKGISFSYSERVAEYIAENSYSQKFGARNMRRFITSNIEDIIAEKIIADYTHKISSVKLDYSEKQKKLTVKCL